MNENTTLYKIQEFAELAGVTVRALHKPDIWAFMQKAFGNR